MTAPLKWTRATPTEAGWWWMKDHVGKTCLVEIRMLPYNNEPAPHAVGGVFSVHIPLMTGVLWAGPIPPPEEAP